jgi:uncharacterized protein
MNSIYYRFVTLVSIFYGSLLGANEVKPDVTVMIPMRDGAQLTTDLYLPTPETRGAPCILIRSPSGREGHWLVFIEMRKLGYVVAVQETRNYTDIHGKTLPFVSDGWGALKDGYDSVEWLAKSPYTNGKIGTWGSSALGITQQLMAPSVPPSLKCQYIQFASANVFEEGIFPGGQLLKHQVESWLGYYAKDSGMIAHITQRCFYNTFWKGLNTVSVANKINVPAIHYGGWYDIFLQGTLAAFESRQTNGAVGAKGTQKLIIGPWTHFWPLDNRLGDFQVPSNGYTPPFDISPERWFDHYLKNVDNGVENLPTVIYYVMGPLDGTPSKGNTWHTATTWPVPATMNPLYLTESHSLEKKPAKNGVLTYLYNPNHPVPTIGGRNLFLPSGPKDQQSIEGREDLLLFSTEPLQDDFEVTGPIIAKIFFNSDQADTDIMVRLMDVYPDGRSILITDGAYRIGVQNPNRQPNEPIEANIDLWATSQVFAKGHRIRVSISSSNYPRFEKNLNVGVIGANKHVNGRSAKNSVLVGEKTPSRIILPVPL